jgi:hypothetical protein
MALRGNIDNLVHQRQLGESQAGSQTRSYLGSVAVDGLFSADDQIDPAVFLFDPFDGLGQNIAGRQRIRPSEHAVRYQNGLVCAQGETLAQGHHGVGRAHAYDDDLPAKAVFYIQTCFHSMGVERVHDKRHPFPDQGARFGIDLYLIGIRNLFHGHDDVFQSGIDFGCHLTSFSRLPAKKD